MRHCVNKFKLGRRQGHRKSLFMNLSRSLLTHGKICTTRAKASAFRPIVEKIITLIKKESLDSRRRLISVFRGDKDYVAGIIPGISSRFKDRPGGYVRVTKVGRRNGDNAPMSVVELV